jgi:heat shock protein HslJ
MPDDHARATLEGIDWRLTHGIDVGTGRPTSARFVDGTLSGQGPVNRYRATYTLPGGGRLSIAPSAMTLMAGPEPAMAAEAAYGQLLAAVASFRGEGDGGLALLDASGDPILRYERAPSGLLALAGPWVIRAIRRGDGVVSVRAGSDAALAFDADAGTVTGSTGINRLRGTVEVHDDRVRFGPLTTTRMAGEPEAMDEESALLDALDSAVAYRAEGDRVVLLDEDGGTLVDLARPEGSSTG